MSKPHVAFVTSDKNGGRITDDDQILADALVDSGCEVSAAVWSDAGIAWQDYDAIVIRSSWDYHLRSEEFAGWLERIADLPVWNPVATLRGNMHKSYLLDLAETGLPVVETRLYRARERCDLKALRDETGWQEFVVKPAISATAHNTWRSNGIDTGEAQARVNEALAGSDLLIQPLISQVIDDGEYSYLFFGGGFSHAVLKRARPGDFRVQSDFGGSVERVFPDADLRVQSQRIADAIPGDWLYARIDVVNIDGRLMLMELELIEPHLFAAESSDAPGLFRDAVLARL